MIIVVLIAYRADWLLKFLYRTSSVQFSVAGLQPIKWDNRRMHNIDLSDIVSYWLILLCKALKIYLQKVLRKG